ncbi:MAG: saccharopine dehydrogenase NADP-binding domain-containing protein [Nitrososphaerota archaeon]|nr:saccharopine dehydrogenase NADP-binding domain-containing protein [Nitrososphaerota archaeon]
MKVGVLGSGMMGSVIAWDLARSPDVDSVVVADMNEERLAALQKRVGARKLSTVKLDLRDETGTIEFMRGFDVVSSALPHGTVNPVDSAAAKSGVKLVDIAFEDPQMALEEAALRSNALLVPGCGVAPGLGGILLAHGVRSQKGADEGHILVGGLPQKPVPPFDYRLVFSVVGLLREYIEEARVLRKGRMVKVMPFSTVEKVRFPQPVGTLEAFCTDGLASLVYTMSDMRVMDEKTLRWPGHAEKMNLLLESGYFSREKVKVEGGEASPLEVSYAVLGRKLQEGGPEDMTVMRVEATGRRSGITFDLVDKYDRVDGVTSMGRTTGYTCSIVTQMVGSGEIGGKGVVPPENAVTGPRVGKLLAELAKRGVRVVEKRRTRR